MCNDYRLLVDAASIAEDIADLKITIRFSEGSLDANVGHLAALTGGDLVVAMGSDMSAALEAALVSLRVPFRATENGDRGRHLRAVRRGGEIAVEELRTEPDPAMARAAGALAASLRLSSLPADQAAALAEREGIVTHLTSLVLLDRAGEAVDGLPVMRKVALPAPRTARSAGAEADLFLYRSAPADERSGTRAGIGEIEAKTLRKLQHPVRSRKLRMFIGPTADRTAPVPTSVSQGLPQSASRAEATSPQDELLALAARIDWVDAADRLAVANLSALPAEVTKALLRCSAQEDVVSAARRLGLDPLLMTIGWLATLACCRSAGRVARLIFRGIDVAVDQELAGLRQKLRRLPR